jgi:hypothetical protein
LPAWRCLRFRAPINWSAISKWYNDCSWIFEGTGSSVCWGYEGDSVGIMLMAAHFGKISRGRPRLRAPNTVQLYCSVPSRPQNCLPSFFPPYICFHPTFGVVRSFRLCCHTMRHNFPPIRILKSDVFWDVTLCEVINRRFGRSCHNRLALFLACVIASTLKMRLHVPPKLGL